MDSIRIGVIGLGRWAREVHLPNLLETPGLEIAAICGRSEENRELARRRIGAPVLETSDYHELLDWSRVDAVLIAVPNHLHETMAIDAMAAGKHVFCEKPAALSPEGCRRLLHARRSSGVVYQIGLELRYSETARETHHLIHQGAIGRPAMMWCNILRDWGRFSGWRAETALSGGVVHELACHYLDLFNWFAGFPPLDIRTVGGSLSEQESPDHLWTTLRYPEGLLANLGICLFAPEKETIRIDAIGSEGRLSVDLLSGALHYWKRGSAGPSERSGHRPDDRPVHGFPGNRESLAAFERAIRRNEPPLTDLEVGCQSVLTCAAVAEAWKTGLVTRPVSLTA